MGNLILDVATGRITDANPFLAKLLGFSHAEMVGQTVGELSPFKDVVSNQAMLERLQKDGYVRYEDLPLETKDGRKVAVEFVSNVYQAGDKQVIQCNIRDITARKKNGATTGPAPYLRRPSERDCHDHRGRAGRGTRTPDRLCERSLRADHGLYLRRGIGRSPRLLQGEKTDRRILEEMQHALAQRQAIRRQLLNDRENCTEFWMDIDLVPIFDVTGKCTHFVAIERDSTAEKKSAELLLWKTALLEAQLDSAIDGILCLVDGLGKRILQNRRLNELWKFPQHARLRMQDDVAQVKFRQQTRPEIPNCSRKR